MPNESDKNTMQANKPTIHTTHQLPIDLANKVIVKPANDNSKMIQQTFRTIQQPPQMRVVRMPSAGTGTQIIQTQLMSNTILKPTIPGRSITVSKSPNTYLPRVTTLNTIQGAKGTQQIRTPTPPSSVAGISPAFVRTSITPRTSSPNAVLTQGTTAWVSGSGAMQVQVPQQIIRSTITQNRTITANIFGSSAVNQNSTLSVTSSTSGTTGQPTYVATVLPQRPQGGATIVYTSQQQQPFIQGQVQRMGIATGSNTRQIRPIQRIPTAGIRVNTSSLSIRQNVPGLAPTTVLATQPRNTTGLASSTTISNTIPARIFQVQSPAPVGQSNQKILSANVMLPIIVNNRITHSVKNPLQQGIIAHVSKLTSGAVSSDGNSITNTMPSMGQTVQVSQGNTQYTTQSTQQQQVQSQIITVSQQQQQQLINNQTVVPLAIGSRNTNIPIKTITVSAANDSGVTVHRALTSSAGNLQATTIMPIAKIVSQQQVVSQQQQTPVYIHTRIPAVSTAASTSGQSQVISVASSTPSSTTVYYEQASLSSSSDNKPTSSESSYSVPSNVRYSEKMIHSIIANSFQNQQQQQQTQQSTANPIRYSPLVVESGQSQSQQQQQQIITQMTVQQQPTSSEAPTHMIVPLANQVPTSPRGSASVLRKANETTPVKAPKKPPKAKNYQIAVPQRPPLAAGLAQLTQNLKPLETVPISPKICESPPHGDDWSEGSTTVSIPNSPRSEDEDLDAMINSNQYNKINEEFAKFKTTPQKIGSGVKRDAGDHQLTPRKKMKHDRSALDIVDAAVDVNNENSAETANTKKKTDVVLKKPQASLLQTYNQTWKHAHNHFLRYNDVRVRDDRRPSVMDLANQPKVVQRVNGWKMHLISGEITELINDETQEMEKLNAVLSKLEASDLGPENEKISELIKGSMQRSRLIIDSFTDSKTQLLKIFDHKDHAADIIARCASKRNFKKR